MPEIILKVRLPYNHAVAVVFSGGNIARAKTINTATVSFVNGKTMKMENTTIRTRSPLRTDLWRIHSEFRGEPTSTYMHADIPGIKRTLLAVRRRDPYGQVSSNAVFEDSQKYFPEHHTVGASSKLFANTDRPFSEYRVISLS